MVQPRLQKTKAQKATARHVRKEAKDEYLDELLEDEEFLEFPGPMAAELH